MRPIKIVLTALLLCGAAAAQTDGPIWRSFSSRTGWSIQYPPGWKTGSCQSCSDAHAAGMYVDFFPPSNSERDGWVMVEPLAPRPANEAASDWLVEIAATANLNPQVMEQPFLVDGRPALRVRYRTSYGLLMEDVYVVAGRQTFSIQFGGSDLKPPIETLPNYRVFNRMVLSFRVQRQ